jgi:serine/threonine-protein kinase RIO1
LELDEEEDSDEENDEVDYQDDSALIESCYYFKNINEHFNNKHSHSHSSTKCQETKQKQQRARGRTKSQSQHTDIDSDTRMTLYKFMKKNVLKDNYGIVNKGKKSLILHAQGGV